MGKENTVQLEQKLIHYRSEIAHFQQKVQEMELELKKEKLRNQYLQKKLYDEENSNIHAYVKEINHLKEKILSLEIMLEEEKKRDFIHMPKDEIDTQAKLQGVFNYSLLLSEYHEEPKQINMMGDLYLLNSGTAPLHNIMVCIRIKPKQAGQLGGKISATHSHSNERSIFNAKPAEEWQFVYENWRERVRESGEYWLKPTKVEELKPASQLSFTGFELQLKQPSDNHAIVVEGFLYCKEIPNGVKVQNNIIINF